MTQLSELSARQQEVIKLLLEGKSNKQIASALNISERTVEFHLKNIYDKFQVSSRVELVLKLGSSTVAKEAEVTENQSRPNLWTWAKSLKEAVSSIGAELNMTNTINSNAREAGTPLQFHEAIRVCLLKYADFKGRATRPEFWWFALFVTLVASALAYFGQTYSNVFLIAMLLPFLAAGARRLHDIGKSGWWQLFLLAPVGGMVLLGILWAQPPTDALPDENPPTG
jgi:DNA-binding CsgD family transcriptional regulator